MNWVTAKENGVEFAIIKGTQGTSFFDSQFTNNWRGTQVVFLPRAPYHWYEPELDPIAQAQHFLAKCPEVGEIPHVFDVEDAYNIPADYAARLKTSLDYVVENLGIIPMIYTRASYWKVYLKKALSWAHVFPLWVAHYKDYLGPLTCLPWTPNTWVLWQFMSSGPGKKYGAVSLEIDMDVTNGEIPRVTTVDKAQSYAIKYMKPLDISLKPTWKDYLIEARFRLRKMPERGIPNEPE